MKKILAIILVIFLCAPVFAGEMGEEPEEMQEQESKKREIIVYDVGKHMENSTNILLAIGGLSFASGIVVAMTSGPDVTSLGIGVQLISWGLVETGFGVYDKNWGTRKKDDEVQRKKFEEMSRNHLIFDLCCMAAGGVLLFINDPAVRGHGLGIMINSLVLSLYDTVNFMIAKDPEKLKELQASDYNFYLVYNGIRF